MKYTKFQNKLHISYESDDTPDVVEYYLLIQGGFKIWGCGLSNVNELVKHDVNRELFGNV